MTSTIKVRNPRFDLSDTPVVWGPNAEAVIGFDAGSPIITPLEVHPLKVMRRAGAEMDPLADAELEASQQRELEVTTALQTRMEQQIQPIYAPDENPATNPEPEHLTEVLAMYDTEDD